MSRASTFSAVRNVSRRILKELETWNSVESKDERGVERLGPIQDDELLIWEAVINGRGVGSGYDGLFSPVIFPVIFNVIQGLTKIINF